MSLLRLIFLVLVGLSPAIASAADGGLQVYLQPLPREADRLTFSLGSIVAVSRDGAERPLVPGLADIGPATARRQRLLAGGSLEAGDYVGLRVTVRRAQQKEPRGVRQLALPDAPVSIPVPFVVDSQRTLVLWLMLQYGASLADQAFSPVFTPVIPSKPMADFAAFVSNTGASALTVVDRQLGQAVAVIDTCAGPSGLALDRRRRRLYVACSRDDEIVAVDVTSSEVVERARLSPGDGPVDVALTPDGRTLVAVNGRSSSVTVFDAEPLTRLERVQVGSGPSSLVIDPAGRQAFVFDTLASSITVVDIARRVVVATMAMEASPIRGGFSARGDRLFVVHERSPWLTVVNPSELTIAARPRLRGAADAIAVDTRRGFVYLGSRDDAGIEVCDPVTLLPLDTLKAGSAAVDLAVDAERDVLYVVNPDDRRLTIVGLGARRVVADIDVGESPARVVVMGAR